MKRSQELSRVEGKSRSSWGWIAVAATVTMVGTGCWGGSVGEPEGDALAGRAQAIRNGTRDPQVVPLSAGEQLAIGWLYSGRQPDSNFCTGTLIAPNLVVTAAHCTEGNRAQEVGFGIGLLPTEPVATFTVFEMHEHPSVDVSLLILGEDATAAVDGLVALPFNREAIPRELIGQNLEASGYGETYDRRRFGRYFAAVELEQIAASEVVVNGNGQQGICYGDSGGPVMAANAEGQTMVLGVESWGDESCVGRDHLTRLDPVADWIDAVGRGEAPPDPCGGLDFLGRCTDDNVSEWCQGGRLFQRDCNEVGTECGFVNNQVGYICTCGDLDYFGRCAGDVAEYCDNGRYAQIDCGSRGEQCGLVNDEVGYFCTNSPQSECDPATDGPFCEGSARKTCQDGTWQAENCAIGGGSCEVGSGGAACQADGPVDPVDPVDSVDPVDPVDSVDPVDPVNPDGDSLDPDGDEPRGVVNNAGGTDGATNGDAAAVSRRTGAPDGCAQVGTGQTGSWFAPLLVLGLALAGMRQRR